MADKQNVAVAVFDHHNEAEAAIKELNRAGRTHHPSDASSPGAPHAEFTTPCVFDLVVAVQDAADGDAEVAGTFLHMFETRHVRFDRRRSQRPSYFETSAW